MEPLIELPQVQRLTSQVTVINGLNPGAYTMQGTNSVLFLQQRPNTKSPLSAILIDPGEESKQEDFAKLVDAELKHFGSEASLFLILATHHHEDHVGGIPYMRERFGKVPVLKRPLLLQNALEDENIESHGSSEPSAIQLEVEKIAQDFSTYGKVDQIDVIDTPGHTDDHVSFILYAEGNNILVAGDIILGQGYSPVFKDLKDFIDSLGKLVKVVEERKVDILIPGHGPVIRGTDSIISSLNGLIKHRMDREHQIVQVISEHGPISIPKIVSVIYAKYPVELHLAAQHSVLLHVNKLLREQRISSVQDIDDKQDVAYKLNNSSNL